MAQMIPDERTRQGPKGRPVFMVLIGSLVLLGIYMAAMTIWAGSDSPDNPSQNASRERVTGSPSGQGGAASSSNTSSVPSANPAYPAPANRTANPSAGSESTGSIQSPAIPQR
jgi:hypothetical protein